MDDESTSAARIKHLELVQGIISRMANNSFLIKGWSVTVAAALFALAAKDSDARFALLAILPIFAFWYLDAYYLRQERLFRQLYEKVRSKESSSTVEPFSLLTNIYNFDVPKIGKTMLSESNIIFHGVIFLTALIIFTTLYGPSCFL